MNAGFARGMLEEYLKAACDPEGAAIAALKVCFLLRREGKDEEIERIFTEEMIKFFGAIGLEFENLDLDPEFS